MHVLTFTSYYISELANKVSMYIISLWVYIWILVFKDIHTCLEKEQPMQYFF